MRIKRIPCPSSTIDATPDPDCGDIPRRRGRARRRGFASNRDSLRVVARFADRHLKPISPPFYECCWRYSPFSARKSHVRARRIADHLKVLVDAADDGRARVQSHRDTHRTDYFCKHRGNVVSQVELATSKQGGHDLMLPSKPGSI